MNKKFSTLMAGLMLASAFSVSAQGSLGIPTSIDKYEDGKYYVLGDGNNVLTVVSDAGPRYGELAMVWQGNGSDYWDLAKTRNALWKVTVVPGNAGDAPKYSFVNVATGMTLSVPTPKSDKDGENIIGAGAEEALMISGGYMEWMNGNANDFSDDIAENFYSYINSTEVVYLMYGNNGEKDLIVKRSHIDNIEDAESGYKLLQIRPFEAQVVELTADDLNKELITNNAITSESSFKLSFDQDVTEGAENLFAGVDLVATQLYKYTSGANEYITTNGELDVKTQEGNKYYGYEKQPYEYVYLNVKDTENYLMVDTALHTGSEAEKQLPKFTYVNDPDAEGDPINGNNHSRLAKSAHFKFAYEPINDRVLIKVEQYAKRVQNWDGTPVRVTGVDGNTAYTYWPTTKYTAKEANKANEWQDTGNEKSEAELVSNAYVRLVTLSSVRELTVAFDDEESTKGNYNDGNKYEAWEGADDLQIGMLTTVKIGEGLMAYVPTTIDASGLYLIQFVQNSANMEAAEGNYYVANLGGAFGYAEQAKNQDYQHIPAAQWYIEKQGTISSAPITITNREFYDSDEKELGPDYQYQLFAVDGEEDTYFFRSGDNTAFTNDTVKFIPVKDVKDAKQGYMYVDEQTSTVETYVFNYLHGLAASNEVGLNTPIAKDSLVRVDETGETIAFRLVPVVVDDSYGKQFDTKKTGIANLIRNAYYIEAYDEIKFAEDNRDRYLTYDTKSKKYVMSTTPTAYFLKENNCVGDVHYYALVEANLFQVNSKIDNGKTVLTANGVNIPALSGTPVSAETIFYPASFAGKTANDPNDAEVVAYDKLYKDTDNKDGIGANFYFYDENGKFIVTDASKNVPLYAYYGNTDNKNIIELQPVVTPKNGNDAAKYYYMNGDVNAKKYNVVANANDVYPYNTVDYADNRVSVDDNTLDLTIASIEDKWNEEIRVSTFAVTENDAPLYRRFNGLAPETYGDASNAPLNLKFYRHNNNQEFLFENFSSENSYRDGITDKSISFLGVNNAMQFAENETRSYTMYVDTAYVRNNTRMPQYLIAVKPEVVEGDTILCDASTHQHATPEEALACEHSIIRPHFVRAMYLFNAQDSIDTKNYDYQGKAAYGAKDYTRLAFKDAVHAMDTLYILMPGVTTEQLIESNFKNDDLFSKKIALDNNKHKNVVFQFRLLDEQDNRFLIESEAEKDRVAVLNKDLDQVCVAPNAGGWVKIQNGVPVIARYQDFQEASAQADVFDVTDEIQYEATDNEEIAVEGVSVVAGDGQVTIMGAAGKNVTITNILGKVIASQTIASDNATISVPAGIVAVAVEGEAAVKAIVK